MNTPKFVVSHMDQQMGPFDEQELKSRWAKGEILAIDYVYDESKADWVLMSERFAWSRAAEVSPPPPVRTDSVVIRKMTAALVNPAAVPASMPAAPAPTAVAHAHTPHATPAVAAAAQPARVAPAHPAPAVKPAPPKVEVNYTVHEHSLLSARPKPAPQPGAVKAAPAAAHPQITLRSEPSSPHAETIAHHHDHGAHHDHDLVVRKETIDPGPMIEREPMKPFDSKLQLLNGVGTLELDPLNPGHIQLMALDPSLKMQQPLEINVRPAEPVDVVWSIPSEVEAGHELEIHLRALDEHGQVCLHYNDQFVIQVRGSQPRDLTVTTRDGEARVKLSNTKAEQWTFKLHYSGLKNLHLPDARLCEWQPGPAARLVLDGPHDYVAGRPVRVQVKAVDAYGNVAKQFQGTLDMKVKAS